MPKTYHPVDYRSTPLFSSVAESDWGNWRWQFKHAIRDIPTLEKVISLTSQERDDLTRCLTRFRMAITPYYAALMDKEDRRCPVRLQSVPVIAELHDDASDLDDPLHEDVDSPVPGLTHRYPDRALLLITHTCSMYCRHCTRRRLVGIEDVPFTRPRVDEALDYIRRTPEIRDVVISGGDPLVLTDDNLEYVLKALRAIEHVEIIRLGTRIPVVLPQRITPELITMLKRYQPIYVNTHFNHPKEITLEAKTACDLLADGGFSIANQSVLLAGINDHPAVMKQLVHELLMIRVRPYYVYQCDLSKGIAHFRTPVAKGIEIIENLRGHTSGLAVPTFVVDAPGGGGKIPVMPNYLLAQSAGRYVLRNYEGVITTYTEPADHHEQPTPFDDRYCSHTGVAKLLAGEQLTLQPENLQRLKRLGH